MADRLPPLVVFGDDWGRHVSTMQHVHRRLLGAERIIWVNAVNHRVPRLTWYDARRAASKAWQMARGAVATPAAAATPTDTRSSAAPGPAATGAVLPDAVIAPRILPWHNHARVRHLNARLLARDIGRALARVAPGERPLLVSGSPVIVDLLDVLPVRAVCYFCMDDYAHLQGVDASLLMPLEREWIPKVDGLVATAASLVADKRPPSGVAWQLPQGVNYEHFAVPQPMPAEMRDLPRPIVGFAGQLGDACDMPLLRELALAIAPASLVFVGPVASSTEALSGLSNVHYLGAKPYATLPAYVQHFDVGIIPYVHNAWTRAVDPLKLLEYCAAGVPVVATALPEVKKYAAHVAVADSTATMIAMVQEALRVGASAGRAERQALARANTWEARAEQYVDHLREIVAVGDARRLTGAAGTPADRRPT
jgi:glycosyltransferase involved in cell wall biosynthesis